MLKFGAFLVPGGLAAWALNQSDRYLLRELGEIGMVAAYGVGFKFAPLIGRIVADLALARPAPLAIERFLANRFGL